MSTVLRYRRSRLLFAFWLEPGVESITGDNGHIHGVLTM